MKERNTYAQKAIFHAICNDIARSGMKWAGKTRSAGIWKLLLISGHAIATEHETPETVEGFEGEAVTIRESWTTMSKERGSSLISYALAWCAENEIPLNDPKILAYKQFREAS